MGTLLCGCSLRRWYKNLTSRSCAFPPYWKVFSCCWAFSTWKTEILFKKQSKRGKHQTDVRASDSTLRGDSGADVFGAAGVTQAKTACCVYALRKNKHKQLLQRYILTCAFPFHTIETRWLESAYLHVCVSVCPCDLTNSKSMTEAGKWRISKKYCRMIGFALLKGSIWRASAVNKNLKTLRFTESGLFLGFHRLGSGWTDFIKLNG